MKKKTLIFYLTIVFLGFHTEGPFAQGITSNNGANMVIGSGSYVVVTTNGISQSGMNTILTNNGTLVIEGALQNATDAVINGNGNYKVGGNWNDNALYYPGTSTVELTGNTAATILENNDFYNLTLNKGATNPIVGVSASSIFLQVVNNLTFTGANNKLQLNGFTLYVLHPIVGYDANKYVITSPTSLINAPVTSTPFVFPIGTSSTSYTPVTVTQTGAQIELNVNVVDQVLAFGTSGAPISTGVVNKTWRVSRYDGDFPNLTVTPQWNSTDQLSGMDNAKCGVSRYDNTTSAWDLTYNNVGARAGAGPYTRTRSGITGDGYFTVGGKSVATVLQLSAKVFLQGAYASASLMNDGLRSQSLIPAGENSSIQGGQTPRPVGFTHQGWGGGEIANGLGIFGVQPNTNDNIVDWVFIELRDPSVSSTVLHTRSALLQRDGDVVNEDGTSPLKIYGVPEGSYYISIKHRNHLGVRSATTKAMYALGPTVMDFTTSLSEALTPVSNPAMASVAGSKYALWGGNANGDLSVNISGFSAANSDYLKLRNTLGTSTNVLSNIYSNQDMNMDGSVNISGFSAANSDYLKLRNILGTSTNTISQPTF
jgi:hypothetical protein